MRKRVPRNLWDYGVRWTTQVMQRTSAQAGGLRGVCPSQDATGETPDTSEHLDFGFCDHVSHKENAGLGTAAIGGWLGVSYRAGGPMPHWVLTQSGTVISRTAVQRITNLDKETDEVKQSIAEFDIEVNRRFKEEVKSFTCDSANHNPQDCSECFDNAQERQ